MYIEFFYIVGKTLMVEGVLTVRFRIYIYIRFGHIYLYIEFLYIVHWFWKKCWWWGGGSNCTVSYIYIYIRFGEYSASWWCPGISFTSKFIFFEFQLKKVLNNWFFQLLARSWFWWRLFSIQNSIKKVLENLIFPAFGTILVLVVAFFYSKFHLKRIKILIFPAFGTSWFWWQLFSIQNNLIWKVLKNWFFPAFGNLCFKANSFIYI